MQITQTALSLQPPESSAFKPRKVMGLVRNERMAGTVAVWKTARTQEQLIAARMSYQQYGRAGSHTGPQTDTSSNLNAISPAAGAGSGGLEQSPEPLEFGFGDLLDMINPLHHIPLVGTIYRAVTGDEIRPVSRVIGGGLFGGPFGAAGGLINSVIEEETGRDIPQTALAYALNEDSRFVPASRRTEDAYTHTADTTNPAASALHAQKAAQAYQTAQSVQTSASQSALAVPQKVAFRSL